MTDPRQTQRVTNACEFNFQILAAPPCATFCPLVTQALPKEVFIEEIQQVLVRVLDERHFAIEHHSAQCIVREILDRAFPFLRPGGREDRNHMEGNVNALRNVLLKGPSKSLLKNIGRSCLAHYLCIAHISTCSISVGQVMHAPHLTSIPDRCVSADGRTG
jgi:hypothetical protein